MSMFDILIRLVLIVLLFGTLTILALAAKLPDMIESLPQAIVTGQTPTSGTALASLAIKAAQFVVHVKLDIAAFADALLAGSLGNPSIFTELIVAVHLIRRVILWQIVIPNQVNPF
ncbi:hypothetical protein [Labrys sp. ZIDIC5]|uniref:hypothetical protein n=1 Tax=Labrys sedimenti TaxID=3106036 RepID=UPI002ACAB8AC|nr:hypothetical protein [Labrys sp. ZIDIC5]MDZ5454610.1 hypothetical protein [Labrys sp. ZIDIC5]